jgi:hypothetical protein
MPKLYYYRLSYRHFKTQSLKDFGVLGLSLKMVRFQIGSPLYINSAWQNLEQAKNVCALKPKLLWLINMKIQSIPIGLYCTNSSLRETI